MPCAAQRNGAPMSDTKPDAASRDHEHAPYEGNVAAAADPAPASASAQEVRSILPKWGSVAQAGAFGAILGGVTSGVAEFARVRQGEISTDEAVETVVKSSAQSAATMAVASVAAHVVRSHPVFGVLALAAAGVGAFLVLGNAKRTQPQPREAKPAVEPDGASVSGATPPPNPAVDAASSAAPLS